MTPQAQQKVTLGILTTVLGAVTLAILSNAWASKVDRAEFDRHSATEAAKVQEVRDIVLDLLCTQQPAHRRCR